MRSLHILWVRKVMKKQGTEEKTQFKLEQFCCLLDLKITLNNLWYSKFQNVVMHRALARKFGNFLKKKIWKINVSGSLRSQHAIHAPNVAEVFG